MVFIIRFSIVPSHFSTAVFSTCDVKFWHFAVATFLTLPKQIFIVYLGVLLVAQDQNNRTQTIVLVITFAITVVMGIYIWFKMKKAKEALLQEQTARQANYSMERLRETESVSTDSTMKPVGSSGSMWDSRSDVAQNMPVGYAPGQSNSVGVALGGPIDSTSSVPQYESPDTRPGFIGYNSNSLEADPYQPTTATPYYTPQQQTPYYQPPTRQDPMPYPSSDRPQTNREWV